MIYEGSLIQQKKNGKRIDKESHKVPKKISGYKYLYHQKISIIFDDGKIVDYHR